MKRIIFIFIAQSLVLQLHSQEKRDLCFDLGVKFITVDWLSGPSLGLSYYNKDRKLNFSIRNDIVILVGRDNDVDSLHSMTYSQKSVEILRYYTLNHFDIEYNVLKISHSALRFGVGYSWVYGGQRENYRLNKEHGYDAVSISLKYPISWMTVELRGDIPFRKVSDIKKNSVMLFPFSFALIYKFTPKHTKENQ